MVSPHQRDWLIVWGEFFSRMILISLHNTARSIGTLCWEKKFIFSIAWKQQTADLDYQQIINENQLRRFISVIPSHLGPYLGEKDVVVVYGSDIVMACYCLFVVKDYFESSTAITWLGVWEGCTINSLAFRSVRFVRRNKKSAYGWIFKSYGKECADANKW